MTNTKCMGLPGSLSPRYCAGLGVDRYAKSKGDNKKTIILDSPCIITAEFINAVGLDGFIAANCCGVNPVILVKTLEIITPALEIKVKTMSRNNNNCNPQGK